MTKILKLSRRVSEDITDCGNLKVRNDLKVNAYAINNEYLGRNCNNKGQNALANEDIAQEAANRDSQSNLLHQVRPWYFGNRNSSSVKPGSHATNARRYGATGALRIEQRQRR